MHFLFDSNIKNKNEFYEEQSDQEVENKKIKLKMVVYQQEYGFPLEVLRRMHTLTYIFGESCGFVYSS